MPRERIRKDIVYKFEELSEDAQQKALELLSDINVDYDWWDSVYDDAKNIGLEITEFDLDRRSYCHGDFTQSAEDVAKAIIKDHGEDCETFKTTKAYLDVLENTIRDTSEDEDPDMDERNEEFLQSLLEDYRILLQADYDYRTSREGIIESIQANEYEFTKNGKLA
jgi:hypothetical protein